MRWLLDECVTAELVAHLRASGHDAAYVPEITPGATDLEVIALAHDETRLLLSEDKDFGDLVYRWKRPVPGLVLLRIDSARNQIKWPRLDAAIGQLGESLFGRYTVVEEARFRSRPLLRLVPRAPD